MQIRLAGYNIPIDSLNNEQLVTVSLTPEIFSAAYARISRSPLTISQLRQEAVTDLVKARKSNQKIIFGMGHHSVAEHAVFNFELEDISRLALESIESFRLNSYTEKSQRYVKLEDYFYIPTEFPGKLQSIYLKTIKKQNEFYQRTLQKIAKLAEEKKQNSKPEEEAKEDSRFALALATFGQVGCTLNARNLEHILRRLALNPLPEVQELAKNLFELAVKVAPSLILFDKPSEFERNLFLKKEFLQPVHSFRINNDYRNEDFKLLEVTAQSDAQIAAALLFSHKGCDFRSAVRRLNRSPQSLKSIFFELFRQLEFFDRPPREFEVANLTFKATISASCFAQLKRHRMLTLLAGNYQPRLGVIVPENFVHVGCDREFLELIAQTNNTYKKIKKQFPHLADYILTNAHRRTVLVKMNFRELYHFVRLRADCHAQWEIRELANKISSAVKEFAPFSTMLLCGKSDFEKVFQSIYRKKPNFSPPAE